MPYEKEFAGYKPLARIANSERVQNIVSRCKKRVSDEGPSDVESLVTEVQPSGWLPDLVLAIDGSYHQLPVENGYPEAELAYLTVASVILDVKKQRELDQNRPVAPLASRRTEEAGSIDCALPGCNVVVDDEPTPMASFRRVFFESIREKRPLSDGETLLETYEALLAYKPTTRQQQCPYGDCPVTEIYVPSPGEIHCRCEQQRQPVGPHGGITTLELPENTRKTWRWMARGMST